jgi:riboflavin synthase
MFTGIIEETGLLTKKISTGSGINLSIRAQKILPELKPGDSVSVNGVCLTVVENWNNGFSVQAVGETVKKSTIGGWKIGQVLNLERALKLNERLGGHLVYGHIDALGTVKFITPGPSEIMVKIETDVNTLKYIAEKGAIAVDGISLTVAQVKDDCFSLAIIPFTFENTNIKELKIGDNVNLETDIISRYVEKFLKAENKGITEEFLRQAGF